MSDAGPERPSDNSVRVLFTEAEIASRVAQLAHEIEDAIEGGEPLVLIGMLRGSLLFLADLARQLGSVHIEFLSISAFSPSGDTGGRVRIEKDLEADISGRRVIIVEDVVDTGLTLSYLISSLRTRGPESLDVAALIDKRARRIIDVPIRFVGFEIGDEFVLGYGLDYSQIYRNVPFVFGVDDLDILVSRPDAYLDDALELARGGEEAQQARK